MEEEPDTIFIQNRDSTSINRFKADIVNALYEIEDKINNKSDAIENVLNSKLSIFEHRLNEFDIKLQDIITKQISANKKLEPLNDVIPTILKHDESVITHEIRLNSLSKEISNACYKYDKMFMDNLYIPGLIGDYCKFKNIREFLDYTQTQLSLMNTFKEKSNNEMKLYKERIEQSLKITSNDLNAISKNCTCIIKNQIDIIKENINERFNDFNEMTSKIQLENKTYIVNSSKDTSELKEEILKVKKIREEIDERNDRTVKEAMEINMNTLNHFSILKNEFNKINRHFLEIAQFIKDVRFKRNINEQITRIELKKFANELVGNKKNSNTIPTSNNESAGKLQLSLCNSIRKEKCSNNNNNNLSDHSNTNTINIQLQSLQAQGISNILGIRPKNKKQTIKDMFHSEINKKKLNQTIENEVIFIDHSFKANTPVSRSTGGNSPLFTMKKRRQSAKVRLKSISKKGKMGLAARNNTTSPDHKLKFNEINGMVINPDEQQSKFSTFIPKLKPKEHMIYKMVKNEYGHMVKTNSSSFFKPNKTSKKL